MSGAPPSRVSPLARERDRLGITRDRCTVFYYRTVKEAPISKMADTYTLNSWYYISCIAIIAVWVLRQCCIAYCMARRQRYVALINCGVSPAVPAGGQVEGG